LGAMMLVFTACSVTKRHYAPGYHVEWHKSAKVAEPVAAKKEKATRTESVAVAQEEVAVAQAVEMLQVASVENNVVVENNAVVAPVATKNTQNLVNRVATKVATKVANQVKDQDSVSIAASNHSNGFKPEWYHWVLAILGFFPTFMFWKAIIKKDTIQWKEIIIACLLYCLCWIPGVIYSIKWMKKEF
jgi:uncharacterized Fe-S cluster-containing radical SAM superfamily protein